MAWSQRGQEPYFYFYRKKDERDGKGGTAPGKKQLRYAANKERGKLIRNAYQFPPLLKSQ